MNEDDRELEDYLRGDSPLSREYAARRNDEPPGKLDDAVLAAARRAAAFDRRRARYRRIRRWSVSVAAAAVVVLGVTLVLDILIFGGPDLLAPPQSRYPVTLEAQREPAPAEDRAALAEEMARQETQRMSAAPPPEPAAFGEKTTEDRAPAREETGASDAESVEPGLPARPAAPEPGDEADRARQAQEAAGSAEAAAENGGLQRARATASRLTAGDHYETPEDWLAEIRRLQQAGRTEQAREALNAFREAYPEHQLPEDIAALATAGE